MIGPKSIRTAASTLAIAAVLSGCAVGQQHRGSMFGQKVADENIGLATRAQSALASGDLKAAVELAERAVEKTPNDAGFRALLGNCYFAAGRFASAEQAYRDSLTLFPIQPKLVLKLALVEIGQGRGSDALAALDAARSALDPADYGLAVALAGRPDEAIPVLNDAARAAGADSRVRQNLALAYALSGDWTMARTVAAQDVPPEELDSRIQKWMAVATPDHAPDQVAMLTGVHPAADPGQPQQLALKTDGENSQLAQIVLPRAPQAQAPVQPQPQPQPRPETMAPADIPAVAPPALPDPEPVVAQSAAAEPAEQDSAPLLATLIHPVAPVESDSPQRPAVVEAAVRTPTEQTPTRFDAPVNPGKHVAVAEMLGSSGEHNGRGRSNSVVQLGAYSSAERVSLAWSRISKRFPNLAEYTPMRARFDGPNGTVWRLSIKGFDNQQEAIERCEHLQSRGGKCFVRHVAGDAPVQFASR